MNQKIIQWKDPSDLKRGFIIDMENGSAAEIFQGLYINPEELIAGFADLFLQMGFPPQESEDMSLNLFQQARNAMDTMIDNLRTLPIPKTNLFPASTIQ